MKSGQNANEVPWPVPRPEVEKVNAYKPPLEGRREFLRLDFNENTIGPSPRVKEALQNIPSNHISIYPEYNGLRESVIDNLSSKGLSMPLNPNQIGLFNGVDAAINAIFYAYGDRGNRLLTTTPTFGYYTPCALMQGMKILALPYEGPNFNFPFNNIKQALIDQTPHLLLLCNPNNPTGTRIQAEKILDLALSSPNTLIVIDELYEAFSGDSVMSRVNFNLTPNILILRSLSKTAGLAGLRIGFAIGCDEVVDRISRVTGPYDINSFAITAAFAALSDQPYIDAYVSKVLVAREWIKKQLIASGLRHHIDGGNYFLVWPKHEPSEIEASLKKKGILVRNMAGKTLIEKSIRVSIGTMQQMKRFWEIFSELDNV